VIRRLVPRSSSRRTALLLLLLTSTFTALAWLLADFDVAYSGEGMHIALDAIQATVFLVVGVLAWARYLRGGLAFDLAITIAFGVISFVESAFLLALPTLLNYGELRSYSVWASAVTTVAAPVVLLVGAAVPQVVSRRRARTALTLVVALAGIVRALTLVLVRRNLSFPIDPALSPVGPHRHLFEGATTILAVEAAAGILLLATAARLLLPRNPPVQPLLGWLGPALVVGGLASLNYALFPSIYSYWVYTGDILRLGYCLTLTAGIVAELRAATRRVVEMAVLEERRRLARDLHDGVAQELSFIATELNELPDALHPSLPWLRSAAARGVFESRRAIEALTTSTVRPLAAEIAAAVEDLTSRSGTSIRFSLDETIQTTSAEREAMLRVAREATINAIRHGRANTIFISLDQRDGPLRLEITDDGTGFDTSRAAQGGFGLTSMRERVAASGGTLRVCSIPDDGTTIEARWRTGPEPDRSEPPADSSVATAKR
jgi:signal transduction histidine kinase